MPCCGPVGAGVASPSATPTDSELEEEIVPVATGATETVVPTATEPERARPGETSSDVPTGAAQTEPTVPLRTEATTTSAGEREVATLSPVHAEDATPPPVQGEGATVGADDLFGHLLQHRERISFGAAYRALLGASGRPWRAVIDVPLVLRAARGTATRRVQDIEIGLDALIVNKKTKKPGSGHFKERPYAEDTWLAHFAAWPLCGHSVEELRVGGERSGSGALPEATDAATRTEGPPSGDAMGAEPRSAARDQESPHYEAPAAEPAPVVVTAARIAREEPAERQAARPVAATEASIAPEEPADREAARADPSGVRRLAAPIGAIVIVLVVVAGSLIAWRVVRSSSAAGEPPVAGTLSGTAGPQEVRERFDSFPIGANPGWQTAGQGRGALGVAPWPTSIDRSVRLQTGPDGRALSACRTISAVRSGVLVAEMRIFFDGFSNADAAIASIRSAGEQVGALRVGPQGQIGGGTAGSPNVPAAMSLATWYDVAFNIDVANRTYRLTVAASDSSRSIVDQDFGWTSQGGTGIDGICFSSPGGTDGRSLYINELRITSR